MDRFKNILVAASPGHLEPLTVRAAVKLAEINNAELTVIEVVAPLPRSQRRVEVAGRIVDVEAALLAEKTAYLQRLAKNAQAESKAKVIVTVGEPFLELIRRVLTKGHDLVMLGERPPERGDTCHLSSGVLHVLRKCPVPVWVMRPSRGHRPRILVLVDPDPGDPVRDGLNDLALELAISLARREGGKLHVGHAWSLGGEATLRTSALLKLPDTAVDAMVMEAETAHRRRLQELGTRHRLDDLGATVHLVSGEPETALPALAERLDVGLIVMGTVARTGLSGLIMGNTAESILQAVRCSVLAVKPAGFVTPVRTRRWVTGSSHD